MAVTVSIPTRIRLDERALRDGRAELSDAFAAAVGRAVGSSIEEVLEPASDGVGVRFAAPEITWCGDGAPDVASATRDELEAIIGTLLSQAVAGIADDAPPSRNGNGSSERGAPVEAVDESRYSPALLLYQLPSYRGGVVHAVVTEGDPDIAPWAGPFLGWQPIPDDDVFDSYLFALAQFGLHRPASGRQGAIFQNPQGQMTFVVYRYPEEEVDFHVSGLQVTDYDVDERTKKLKEVQVMFPSTALYHLSSLGAPGNDVEKVLRTFYTPVLTRLLSRHRRPISANGPTEAEFALGLNAQIERVVKDEQLDMANVIALFRLEINENPYLVKARAEGGAAVTLPDGLKDVRLVPILVPKERPGTAQVEGQGAGGGPGASGVGGAKGDGTGTATGAGKGTGTGTADGTETGRGSASGFVDTGEETEGGLFFPRAPAGAENVTFECTPYLGEPSVSALGKAGQEMKHIIAKLAWRLQIPECEFAGNFLLNAAAAIHVRATNIGIWETTETGTTASTPAGGGNLGQVDFVPAPSLQIQFLRHLATTVPYFTQLRDHLADAYKAQPDLIRGDWEGKALSWLKRFDYTLNKSMEQAVGRLFAMTCEVIFLQLLNSSHKAIQDRLDDSGYAARFRQYLLPQLRTVSELVRVREILDHAPMIVMAQYQDPLHWQTGHGDVRYVYDTAPPVTTPPATDWREAVKSLMDTLRPQAQQPAPPTADKYELYSNDDGYVVRDLHGTVWDKDSVENAIDLRRGTLESIEPLVKQFVDLPEVIARFRDPAAADAEPEYTLKEMRQKNEEIQRKARGNLMYGYYATSVVENVEQATIIGTSYRLIGIHEQAHAQIGDFFQGDRFYALGVEALFDEREGREELAGAILFAGLVLLSVVCPPAAALLGLEMALVQYAKAAERRDVYQALIDPELVLSRAEVESGLFAAKIGIVLALIPVAQEGLAEAKAALNVAERAGVEAAEEAGTRALSMGERAAAHLAEVLERGLVETFAVELAKQWLISKVMEASLSPLIRMLQSQPGDGPIGGLEAAVRLMAERAEERLAEGGAP